MNHAPSTQFGPELTLWPEERAARYRAQGYWLGQPLHEILAVSVNRRPNDTAIVDGARRLSYRELSSYVTKLSSGLLRLGLGSSDKVIVQLPNCLEAIVTYFALFRIGTVPIMALPGHRLAELDEFARQTRAKAYVTAENLGEIDGRELARQLRKTATSLQHVIVVGEPGDEIPYERLVSGQDAQNPAIDDLPQETPVDARAIALLQLSGGSTGTPKLIPRTHDDYFYSIRRSVEVCGFTRETIYLVALPLAHNFPMSSPGFLGCLYAGGTVVLASDASPDRVFSLLSIEQVTVTAAVPPLALAWLQALTNRGLDFPHLQLLQVGGAKLSEEQAEQLFSGFGCQLQQVFGMAEGLVCYTRLDGPRDHVISSQGHPMSADDEVRVVDENDQPVPDGVPGQLLTRGPYTICGYYKAAEHNQRAFSSDGFYRTGDIVVKNPDQSLTVVGRSKHQINRGGEKIAPSELERHLASHPSVSAVAVVGVPDDVLGERIAAFVVQKRGVSLNRTHLLSHLRERGVAVFKLPDRFEFVQELPRTHVGKVDTRRLQSPSEAGLGLTREIAELLKADPDEFQPTTNLLEWGMDSLHLMMLVERFRERGAEVDFVELAENPTIEAFEELLRSRSPSTIVS